MIQSRHGKVTRLMSQEPVSPKSRRWNAPPPLVALAGWALPGAGYLLIGHKARGITIGLAILGLFTLGMLIGGMRVVDPPNFGGDTGNLVTAVLAKPWYIGQFLSGLTGVACGHFGAKFPQSHARVMEIGTLYTAVAGMLNLMTIVDCSFRAAAQEGES